MSTSTDSLAACYLLLGEEELLVDRAKARVLKMARQRDSAAELTRIKAAELTVPIFIELTSPSLFGAARIIAVDTAHEISQPVYDAVLDYLREPADDVVLVMSHSGGGRSKAAKALPAALRKANAYVVDCAKLTRQSDRENFIRNEVRQAGGQIDAPAINALVETIGSELRELSAAVSQLVADAGGKIDELAVRRYHRGRAEVTGFAVADRVVAGERAAAVESVRWAIHSGVPHVLVADALADAIRTIFRVAAAGRGNPQQMASELGMPPWKIRKAQGHTRLWSEESLVAAMQIVAQLNADVKGAAAHQDYALEKAVVDLINAKERA